ncbi:MAG: PKD domain-containing protein [Thermoplasmata archaeon]|nr:PKD domain-containing protein [Thermoplasmata archaeon]
MKIKNRSPMNLKPKSQINIRNAEDAIFNKRLVIVVIFAFYFAFILVSRVPIIAEDSYTDKMQDSYTHHLTYKLDGLQGHYYVERYDTTQYGYIDLTYTTASNTLEVECRNVKILWIDSRSMYEDECEDVYGIDPSTDSNYYKKYFIDRDHFNVHVYTQFMIQNLTFIDVPLPYNVSVNSQEWWRTGINYTYDGKGMVFTKVPAGHTNVDIYFKSPSTIAPVAKFTVSSAITGKNEKIYFDASDSYDPDGYITAYIWDFGNGDFDSEPISTYSFSDTGNYSIILTVIDNDFLIGRAYTLFTITDETSPCPKIIKRIPNQEKEEDSPPWALDLTNYEYDKKDSDVKLNWYITDIDTSLFRVTGEWSSDDIFIFYPVPNAYGNDEVTIWLIDTDGYMDSQQLWINLTPLNDPPVFFGAPDIILHYDDPYTFYYGPYIYDVETPKEHLVISTLETTDESYTQVEGLNVTYEYPISYLNQDVFVTITVSDSEDTSVDIIKISVTDDWVPELVEKLPDVVLEEGTIKENVFDLDDYFVDPDMDSLFYSYGETHVNVTINNDHTVDIASLSEWFGVDTVTFRAEDPIGALAEDTILVTVIPVNDAPTISGVPDLIVHYDYDYEFDLTSYIHDKDNDTSDLRVYTSDLDHIRFDDNSPMQIIVHYPLSMLGMTVPVTITVTDGIGSNAQVISITVSDDHPPELWNPLPDIEFEEDTELLRVFDLDNFFFDLDGDSLYYSYGYRNVFVSINDDNTVNFAAEPDWYGIEIVKFRAEDPEGALAEDTIVITVLPINDAPVVNDIPDQEGMVDEMWVLDLTYYLEDVDNNITELEINIDSDLVVVNGLKLVFYSERATSKEITMVVSDGDEYTIHTFNVNFIAGESVVTVSELFYWSILIIVIIIVVSLVVVVRKYKGNYKVEDIFVIHEDGTLLLHKTRRKKAAMDDDILSGMLTAVQDFIKEGFAYDAPDQFPHAPSPYREARKIDEWQLHQLKLEDHNILIERGASSYIAIIFTGTSGWRLERSIKQAIKGIEGKYGDILGKWSGRMSSLKGIDKFIEPLLSEEKPEK